MFAIRSSIGKLILWVKYEVKSKEINESLQIRFETEIGTEQFETTELVQIREDLTKGKSAYCIRGVKEKLRASIVRYSFVWRSRK